MLINQLLDEGRESRLGMVVVDEMHLVSDAQRGFLLEVLLTKVRLSICVCIYVRVCLCLLCACVCTCACVVAYAPFG